MGPKYFETLNTLQAGWLELRLARWFGERRKSSDGCFIVDIAKWRGKSYLIDYREIRDDDPVCPNCDCLMPEGCRGEFESDGFACWRTHNAPA